MGDVGGARVCRALVAVGRRAECDGQRAQVQSERTVAIVETGLHDHLNLHACSVRVDETGAGSGWRMCRHVRVCSDCG